MTKRNQSPLRMFAMLVKRKVRLGGIGYAASALGVMLIGVAALLFEPQFPATAMILLIAVVVALTGLGLRWRKRIRHQKRREAGVRLRI